MEDRRQHDRKAYEGLMTYRRLGPAKRGRVRNLGEGGLMVDLPELFQPGTPLTLDISLGGHWMHAETEVVWSHDRPDNESYSHGLRVTRLDLQRGAISPPSPSGLHPS